jgi:hypothetical protein
MGRGVSRPFRLYTARTHPYVPRRFETAEHHRKMRNETQIMVDEIKQAIGLLRRHL